MRCVGAEFGLERKLISKDKGCDTLLQQLHRAIVGHNAQHATIEKAYNNLKEAGVYYSGTYHGWYHGWERDGLQTDMTEVKHVHVVMLACTSLLLVL